MGRFVAADLSSVLKGDNYVFILKKKKKVVSNPQVDYTDLMTSVTWVKCY